MINKVFGLLGIKFKTFDNIGLVSLQIMAFKDIAECSSAHQLIVMAMTGFSLIQDSIFFPEDIERTDEFNNIHAFGLFSESNFELIE